MDSVNEFPYGFPESVKEMLSKSSHFDSDIRRVILIGAGFELTAKDEVTCPFCLLKIELPEDSHSLLQWHILSSPKCRFIIHHSSSHAAVTFSEAYNHSEALSPTARKAMQELYDVTLPYTSYISKIFQLWESLPRAPTDSISSSAAEASSSAVETSSSAVGVSSSAKLVYSERNIRQVLDEYCYEGFAELKPSDVSNTSQLQLLGVNTQRARHPEFEIVARRRDTFLTYPYNATRNPDALVDAGYFYAGGEDDSVVCFSCGIVSSDWRLSEEAWDRHARSSKLCQFVISQKGPDFIAQAIESAGEYRIPRPENRIYANTERNVKFAMEVPAVQQLLELGLAPEHEVKAVVREKVVKESVINYNPMDEDNRPQEAEGVVVSTFTNVREIMMAIREKQKEQANEDNDHRAHCPPQPRILHHPRPASENSSENESRAGLTAFPSPAVIGNHHIAGNLMASSLENCDSDNDSDESQHTHPNKYPVEIEHHETRYCRYRRQPTRSGPKVKHLASSVYDPTTSKTDNSLQQLRYYQKDLVRICRCGKYSQMDGVLIHGRSNDCDGYEIHYNQMCKWKAFDDFKTGKRVLVRLCKCYADLNISLSVSMQRT